MKVSTRVAVRPKLPSQPEGHHPLRSPAQRDPSLLSHTKDMHVRYDERSKTLGLAYYSEATPTGHVAPVTAAPATADKMAFPALLQTASSAVAGPAAKRRAMLMTALASAARRGQTGSAHDAPCQPDAHMQRRSDLPPTHSP